MKNLTHLSLLTFLLILSGCNELEEKLIGSWVVDQAYYHDEPVMWDLYSNGFSLNENHTATLPISNWEDRHTDKEKGTWKAFKENGAAYLKIDTKNPIFGRTFEIQDLRRVQDSISLGYLMKMTLVSDSLKMVCTKALYE